MKFINYLNSLKKYGIFLLFLIIGLIIFLSPMINSGFGLLQGNNSDIFYSAYVLEHSFLFLKQAPFHYEIWNMPILYPLENTLSFEDFYIGLMPLYWVIRAFNKNPLTSFQILFIVLNILNYSIFYYLFKKQLKFSSLASSVASFIFAFSILRYLRCSQIQFFSQFYSILALIFILKVGNNNKNYKNHLYVALSSVFLALQFYTCYFYGFYSIFILFWGVIIALLPKTGRDFILNYFRQNKKFIILFILYTIMLNFPLATRYIAQNQVNLIESVYYNSTNFWGWIRNLSVLDSYIFKNLVFLNNLKINEMSCSIGFFTMIAGIFGLFKIKYSKGVPIILLILIFLCSIRIDDIFVWKYFYYFTIGSEGISYISRIAFISLIIFCFGIGYLINYLQKSNLKHKNLILFSIILLMVLENIPYQNDVNSSFKNYVFKKNDFIENTKKIENEIKNDCKVFYLKPDIKNLDYFSKEDKLIQKEKIENLNSAYSLWITANRKIYTLNGYKQKNDEIETKEIKNFCKIKKIYDAKAF